MLRVYSKEGNVKVLSTDSLHDHVVMIEDGWEHTATINPILWIESLCNGSSSNIDDMVDELHLGPPKEG